MTNPGALNPTPSERIVILLIDDQPIIAEAIRRMLVPETDIVFHYCSEPTQAIKVARSCQPTVILQDLVMPDMDGLMLVKFLRSHDAPTQTIPLIVLSSKEEPLLKAKAFELGANDYLVKLPDRVELIARVRYHTKAYLNAVKRQEAETRLKEENYRQAQYIQQVNKLTTAAAAVENHCFQADLLKDVAVRPDELGKLAHVFTRMVETVQMREQELKTANTRLESLVQSYGRFVPHEYLSFLQKQSITEVQLGDHVSKVMAIMFSDIRSFTTLSETMTPKDNFAFVNAYLKRVTPIIRDHKGIVVKFMGDGLMAVFPDRADDALSAGISKLQRIQEYNQERIKYGHIPIEIGIGIHVGNMMMGMVGDNDRMQGDALSDNVNLTSRLEGLTKFYGVALLISEQTREQLVHPERYQLRFLDRAIVKGRNEAIAIYEVLNATDDETRERKLLTISDFMQGITYYRQAGRQAGMLEAARECFQRVLQVLPSDKTAQLYLKRVEQLVTTGIPEGWNGIWAFTQK